MKTIIMVGAAVLGLAFAAQVQAQTATVNFEQAAYVTCREAHAMAPEPRSLRTHTASSVAILSSRTFE